MVFLESLIYFQDTGETKKLSELTEEEYKLFIEKATERVLDVLNLRIVEE